MAIITYVVEAGRYDDAPAELACDEAERKAFEYPCRTPSSMFDFVVVIIIGGGGLQGLPPRLAPRIKANLRAAET